MGLIRASIASNRREVIASAAMPCHASRARSSTTGAIACAPAHSRRLNDLHSRMRIQNDRQQRAANLECIRPGPHPRGHTPALATGLHGPPASSSGVSANTETGTSHRVQRHTHLESLPTRSTHHNDPQLSWLKTALKSLDPVRRRWLCAHWIDGLSITAIASLEGIDRRTLQRLLNDSLRDLRRQAVAATS